MLDNSLPFAFGSCIDFDIVFKHPDELPDDISEDRFIVADSFPAIIAEAAVLTKPDPTNGVLHLHLPADAARQLYRVDVNRLRILRRCSDGCDLSTQRFGIILR